MNGLLNVMRQEAGAVDDQRAVTKLGTISSFDPDRWAVKVMLQPEATETGWLPLGAAWVGNGFGLFAAPSLGEMVEVQFQEDDREAGIVGHRFFSDVNRPLPVPAGEFWLLHKSGSMLKLHNDGSVEIESNQNLTARVGGNLSVTVESGDVSLDVQAGDVSATVQGGVTLDVSGSVNSTATNFNFNGDVVVTGSISATADIDAAGGISAGAGADIIGNITGTGNLEMDGSVSDSVGSVESFRNVYNSHAHNGDFSGLTSTPIPPTPT